MAKKYISKTTGTETITKARNIVVAAPYDVRGVVETYADLLDKDTYSYSELYVGMLVITYDTQDVYVLSKLPGSRDNATAWAQNIKWKKINDVNKDDISEFLTASDLDVYALKSELPIVPTNVGAFTNDVGYLTENDLPDFLEASDLDGYVKTEELANYIPVSELENLAAKSDLDGYVKTEDAVEYLTSSDLDAYALKSDIPVVPTNVSAFTNDAGYLTKNDLPDFLLESDLEDYVKTEDLEAYIPKTELENLATKSDLDGYVKTEDAVEFLTASDLDIYALKSELPVNVSELTNDAGYLTQHQDLSAYALKSELPLEGSFPADSDIDGSEAPVDGYATVQGVIDYVDAYFEKKKDELEEPDYIYVNGIKIEDLNNLPTPTSIYQMNQYEIDDDILTNGLMVLINNEIVGFDGEGDPANDQSVIYSVIFSFDVPTNYSVNYYGWDENKNDWSTVSDIVVSNPRYSTKQYGRKTYNCYVRYTEGDNYYTALNTTVKYKITINKI